MERRVLARFPVTLTASRTVRGAVIIFVGEQYRYPCGTPPGSVVAEGNSSFLQ
jgi:hypothetical protein